MTPSGPGTPRQLHFQRASFSTDSVKGSSKCLGHRGGRVNEHGYKEEEEERLGTTSRSANSSVNRVNERPLVCDRAVYMLSGDGGMLISQITWHILGTGVHGDKAQQNWCHCGLRRNSVLRCKAAITRRRSCQWVRSPERRVARREGILYPVTDMTPEVKAQLRQLSGTQSI